MKSGQLIHVWIDAQTYLEAKVEGQAQDARRQVPSSGSLLSGLSASKRPSDSVCSGDESSPGGANEDGVEGSRGSAGEIMIEKVVVNPQFDDALFTNRTPEWQRIPVDYRGV